MHCFKYIALISTLTISAYNQANQQHITVIIPSYNNEDCAVDNLNSVMAQDYPNFDVIYINDASTDTTGEIVEHYISQNNLENTITYIRNPYNRKAMANLYKAVNMCDDSDLVVLLDGDDCFAHSKVLSMTANIYEKEDVWIAYGQYINVPTEMAAQCNMPVLGYGREAPPELLESGQCRNGAKWHWSGCRSFYAWLFKQIKVEHMIFDQSPHQGKFFPAHYDGAIMYPMIEMSRKRVKFISDIVLLRNVDTPLNDFKINLDVQKMCNKILRKINPYNKLTEPVPGPKSLNDNTLNLVLFANHTTQDCLQTLHSLTTNGLTFNKIYIVTRRLGLWNTIKQYYPNVSIVKPKNTTLLPLFNKNENQAPFTLITHDKQRLDKQIDQNKCLDIMKQTYAYGTYLGVNKTNFGPADKHAKDLSCEHLEDNIYLWQFKCYKPLLDTVHSNQMVIYRTDTIQKLLAESTTNTNIEGITAWYDSPVPENAIGLFID